MNNACMKGVYRTGHMLHLDVYSYRTAFEWNGTVIDGGSILLCYGVIHIGRKMFRWD